MILCILFAGDGDTESRAISIIWPSSALAASVSVFRWALFDPSQRIAMYFIFKHIYPSIDAIDH